MENKIPSTYAGVVTKAEELANGADQYAETIPLLQNTPANIRSDIAPTVDAGASVVSAKTELRTRERAVQAALKAARDFLIIARDISKPELGSEANENWVNLGLVGSMAIPKAERQVVGVLRAFHSFLANNASFEVQAKNITAAKALELLNQLVNARTAVGLQKKHLADQVLERQARAAALRKRIRGVIDELAMRLTPVDNRWLAFKLNKPGAVSVPTIPTGVTASMSDTTGVEVSWGASVRARYYRVWLRVGGEEQEFVNVGDPADLNFTIQPLPFGAPVEVAVSAVNDGGESAMSAIVTVAIPK